VYWLTKKPKEIAKAFKEEFQENISNGSVKRLLKELGYGYRRLNKSLAMGYYTQRNEQFNIIFNLLLIMNITSPVISIDCKKKENLGNLYRDV
jgi:hypothetical protein